MVSRIRIRHYLFYALGELILVVIGILIALQINNLNEEHKMLSEEREIIKALKLELEENQQILLDCIQELDRKLSGMDWMRKLELNEAKNYSNAELLKQIGNAMGNTLRCNVITYILDDIRGADKLRLIRNDDLRLSLTKWSTMLNDLKSEERSWEEEYRDQFLPFTYNKMSWNDLDHLGYKDKSKYPPSKFDVDLAKMIETLEFENVIAINYWRVSHVKNRISNLIQQTNLVLEYITT